MPSEKVQSVSELSPEGLVEALAALDQPAYRAKQILAGLYQRLCLDYDGLTDLPKVLRARLASELPLISGEVAKVQRSRDGTRKVLTRLADGATVETVMIPDGDRRTACLSTQVGCPIGCRFCASGMNGLQRNLTAGEIVEQWLRVSRLVRDEGAEGLTNVVIMGMGEPLMNYQRLLTALRRLNDERCAGFGARRMTVSTVGFPDRMDDLAGEGLAVNLALSLQAPDDGTRDRIIPANERWPGAHPIAAARRYRETTGRDVTFEYILLDGVNDSDGHATRLARLAGRHLNVNLIPYNSVKGLPFAPSPREKIDAFAARLESAGVVVHVRRARGKDIDAACGQLRRREAEGA